MQRTWQPCRPWCRHARRAELKPPRRWFTPAIVCWINLNRGISRLPLLFSSRMEVECRIRQAGVPNFGTAVHRMLCVSSSQLGCVAWPGAVNLKSIGIGRSDSRVGICISGRQSICLGICPHTTRQSLMKPNKNFVPCVPKKLKPAPCNY